MSEQQGQDENRPKEANEEGSLEDGRDLRSLLEGRESKRRLKPTAQYQQVRASGDFSEPESRPQRQEKLPPVWPGDEEKPWFRRERGLPPLPDAEAGEDAKVDPRSFPTPLAERYTRGGAWGVTTLLPNVLSIIPSIGFLFVPVLFVLNLYLFRQGQDVGAVLFRLRVVRDNGDVAGFFQMFVRNTASAISLLALGMGFITAFSDPNRRTWHDKWLGTYVVEDSEEYRTRKRSSSDQAVNLFWLIILMTVALVIIYSMTGTVPTDAPTNGGGGGAVS